MIVYSYIEWKGSDSNAAQIKRKIYKTAVLVNLDYATEEVVWDWTDYSISFHHR